MLWVSLHALFFFCHFCLLLVFFLRDVLGSNVAVQEATLLHWACTVGLCGVWCVGWVGGILSCGAASLAARLLRLPIYLTSRVFHCFL